jgi:hypothetical protein
MEKDIDVTKFNIIEVLCKLMGVITAYYCLDRKEDMKVELVSYEDR